MLLMLVVVVVTAVAVEGVVVDRLVVPQPEAGLRPAPALGELRRLNQRRERCLRGHNKRCSYGRFECWATFGGPIGSVR